MRCALCRLDVAVEAIDAEVVDGAVSDSLREARFPSQAVIQRRLGRQFPRVLRVEPQGTTAACRASLASPGSTTATCPDKKSASGSPVIEPSKVNCPAIARSLASATSKREASADTVLMRATHDGQVIADAERRRLISRFTRCRHRSGSLRCSPRGTCSLRCS